MLRQVQEDRPVDTSDTIDFVNIAAFIAIAVLGILTFIGVTHKPSKKSTETTNSITTATPASGLKSDVNIENTPTSYPTLTQAPNQPTQTTSLNINDFIYPSSTQNSKSFSSLSLTSSDYPNTISSWYQQKINNLHMSAKSAINTTTNGNTQNTLDAAGNGSEVKVNITRDSDATQTTISVTISANNSNSVNNSVNSTNNSTIYNNINTSTNTSNTY